MQRWPIAFKPLHSAQCVRGTLPPACVSILKVFEPIAIGLIEAEKQEASWEKSWTASHFYWKSEPKSGVRSLVPWCIRPWSCRLQSASASDYSFSSFQNSKTCLMAWALNCQPSHPSCSIYPNCHIYDVAIEPPDDCGWTVFIPKPTTPSTGAFNCRHQYLEDPPIRRLALRRNG